MWYFEEKEDLYKPKRAKERIFKENGFSRKIFAKFSR